MLREGGRGELRQAEEGEGDPRAHFLKNPSSPNEISSFLIDLIEHRFLSNRNISYKALTTFSIFLLDILNYYPPHVFC